jgi:hypothetical protein
MAVVILSLFIMGRGNDGGPGVVIPPADPATPDPPTVTTVTVTGNGIVTKDTGDV